MTFQATQKQTCRTNAGFTLVELMVVIVILAALAAIVVPNLVGIGEQAKIDTTKTSIQNLEDVLAQFEVDNGFFPTTEQGLEALVTPPSTGREPKKYREGGYTKRLPVDGWGNPFVYIAPGANGPYDITSYGADGLPGGDGDDADINNWEL